MITGPRVGRMAGGRSPRPVTAGTSNKTHTAALVDMEVTTDSIKFDAIFFKVRILLVNLATRYDRRTLRELKLRGHRSVDF